MNTNIYTPKLTICRANAKLTGAAIMMELRPAHGTREGAIYCRLANQATLAGGGIEKSGRVLPSFDWANGITFRLGFDDITKFLQVFRGETEALEDGKGILHVTADHLLNIRLKHTLEPQSGYMLEVRRTKRNGSTSETPDADSHIFLKPNEALGLCEAFTGALLSICFGTGFEQTAIDAALDEEMARHAEEELAKAKAAAEKDGPLCPDAAAPSDAKPADPIVPTDEEYRAAYKQIMAYYGPEAQMPLTAAFGCLQNGKPLVPEQIEAGIAALGTDHKLIRYAKFIGDVDLAMEKCLEYYSDYKPQVLDAFRRVRTAPSSVSLTEINYGAEALGEDHALVRFFRDLHKAD